MEDLKVESASTSEEGGFRFARGFAQELAADADLARIVASWHLLPPPIRAAMLALAGMASA